MDTSEIIELEKKHIMQTYARPGFVIDHGIGCCVYDKNGKEYLDFVGGIATVPAGHANKAIAKAVYEQSKKLTNITNLYYTEPQVLLAKKLAELSGLNKCFFSNSGTESIEAAIKLVRKHTKKTEIIAMQHGFHGRTFGSLAATDKEKIKKSFEPMLSGFKHVPYDDIEAVKASINNNTAAVILEPIQGEAGIIVPKKGYLKEIRQICDEKNILMILDEIQSGTGRTGKFFAYQHEGILPDIVTLAKGLANGIPIGVTIAKEEVANSFEPGDHASTFGGNNLSCSAAIATIDFILEKNLMENAFKQGNYFIKKLGKLAKEVRGKGLMIAIELENAKEIQKKCLEKGLLINTTDEKTIRFLPPLIIKRRHIDKAISILGEVI